MRRSSPTPQLITTLGPASLHLARALCDAGTTALRLNASHLDAEGLRGALATIRRDVPAAEIVVDLQGAKMRLGTFAARDVSRGQRLTFGRGAADIPVAHPEIVRQVHPGDTISVDDGRIRFAVEACGGGTLTATALDDARLLPRKGINVEEHPVVLDGLTPADRDAMAAAASFGVRSFAFSFMTDGHEAEWLRSEAPGCRVVAKVERREASVSLDRLAQRADAIWICRGDLGVQLGPAALARFVASVRPEEMPVPVLMAGQVLEHATHHGDFTRSEVCHLYDLVARGYAGFVLSDETAIGADPVHTVAAARALLDAFRA